MTRGHARRLVATLVPEHQSVLLAMSNGVTVSDGRGALRGQSMSKVVGCAGAVLFALPIAAQAAQAAPMGWPEVIDLLTRERSQAETCVGLVKSRGDAAAVDQAKTTYLMAKEDMDGVIAGLEVVLADGGKPESLPAVRASLDASGKSLKTICDAAVRTATPNTKGVWDELAKGAIEPVVNKLSDGISALWTRHVEKDKLAMETKKAKLEAAKWPEFGDIAGK
jgi:hypothetical protein